MGDWREQVRPVADVREAPASLLDDAEHLLAGVRRLCVRRHYIVGESSAPLTSCPVISPWPGQEDKICGADLYPGFLLGEVGDDPLTTIRQLVDALRMVSAQRDAAIRDGRRAGPPRP